MSSFIENSKHPQMTAAIESHFGTAKKRSMPGEASGKDFALGGDPKFKTTDMPFPEETGVNHRPHGNAGHTVK